MKGEGEQDGEPKTVHRKDVPANSRATLHRFRLGPDAANNASASRKKGEQTKSNAIGERVRAGPSILHGPTSSCHARVLITGSGYPSRPAWGAIAPSKLSLVTSRWTKYGTLTSEIVC
jgi:hypothetical protein